MAEKVKPKKKEREPAVQRIGRYRIQGELGRGAMGVVYRARDPALDRSVALKTINLSEDAEGRKEYEKRFFVEAKAAGKLAHPNIVTIFDFGEVDGIAYLAMELLEGEELRSRMQAGDISTLEAVEIAAQVAEGLGFAHEHGVVHRDIKPGNIMVPDRGPAKITDFGIARMRATDSKTSTGMVVGTPRYMSPEQVSGTPVDQRSDIFSLGIVLYEMLTRSQLFAADDVAQIAHNVAHLDPVPPSQENREVPPMLDFVVLRALKKDPAVRYQDAYEMAFDLRQCAAELRARLPAKGDTEETRTVKLEQERAMLAPAAGSIALDTRLPLSRLFDSTTALQRLAKPGRRDGERLRRTPRPLGLLSRLSRDPGPRLLLVVAVLAALLGAYIAF